MEHLNDIRPKRVWYWVGSAMMIVPIALMIVFFGSIMFFAFNQKTEMFVAPGEVAVQVDEPGAYIVWTRAQGTVDGAYYSAPERLPEGLRVSVFDETDSPVALGTSLGSGAGSSQSGQRQITSFDAATPGRYRVVIEGDFQQRVCGVQRSLFRSAGSVIGVFGSLLILQCATPLLFLGGLAIVIVTLVRRISAKRALGPPSVPS